MIAVKEVSGKIYVAQVPPATGDSGSAIPVSGQIADWFYIGPGQTPFVSWSGDNTYVITFNYLSQVVARVISMADWPPQQVDPVTYTPAITIQRPEVWVPVSTTLQTPLVLKGDPAPVWGYLKRDYNYIYYNTNLDQYTISLSRDPGMPQPSPATRKGYLLYWSPKGQNQWTVLGNWAPDFTNFIVQTTGSMRYDFALSWGEYWSSGDQNFPDGYNPAWQIHPDVPVTTASVDSNIESLAYVLSLEDNQAPPDPLSTTSALQALPNSHFWYETPSETLPVYNKDAQMLIASDMIGNYHFLPMVREYELQETLPDIKFCSCSAVSLF
jgi:hypothetical protein